MTPTGQINTMDKLDLYKAIQTFKRKLIQEYSKQKSIDSIKKYTEALLYLSMLEDYNKKQ